MNSDSPVPNRKRSSITIAIKALSALVKAAVVLVAIVTAVGFGLQTAAAATCPAGTRPITFTNKCNSDVWIGENLSQPQVDGTPTCTKESDCTNLYINSNLKCVAGAKDATSGQCTLTCLNNSDCGPGQTCMMGKVADQVYSWYRVGTKIPVGECFFSNLEPTSTSMLAPSSNWQLLHDTGTGPGTAQICVAEAQQIPGKLPVDSKCTQPSDCGSYNCFDPTPPRTNAHRAT